MRGRQRVTKEVTKVITERKKKPWFGNDLKQQKRKVQRREKCLGNIDYNPAFERGKEEI